MWTKFESVVILSRGGGGGVNEEFVFERSCGKRHGPLSSGKDPSPCGLALHSSKTSKKLNLLKIYIEFWESAQLKAARPFFPV